MLETNESSLYRIRFFLSQRNMKSLLALLVLFLARSAVAQINGELIFASIGDWVRFFPVSDAVPTEKYHASFLSSILFVSGSTFLCAVFDGDSTRSISPDPAGLHHLHWRRVSSQRIDGCQRSFVQMAICEFLRVFVFSDIFLCALGELTCPRLFFSQIDAFNQTYLKNVPWNAVLVGFLC
jgi:hypothetical protein